MYLDALLAYSHFAAMLVTAALLAVEMALLAKAGAGLPLQKLKVVDGMYGLFASLTLATGVARVFWGAKGSEFYLKNPVFHTKVTLFVLAALISIWPTIQFLKWAKAHKTDQQFAPAAHTASRVRSLVLVQLVLFAFIPLAATMMARGIGLG